jgi:hypothetical protein
LTPSPSASLLLNADGTFWSSVAQGVGPGIVSAAVSDFSVSVQPFVADRFASLYVFGPTFPLLSLSVPAYSGGYVFDPCRSSTQPSPLSYAEFSQSPLPPPQNYGPLSYGDPFSDSYLRFFQYCQVVAVSLEGLNSSPYDVFIVADKQITALPTGLVTPLLSAVQNPILNGITLIQAATLNATPLKIAWTAPAIGTPYLYYLRLAIRLKSVRHRLCS